MLWLLLAAVVLALGMDAVWIEPDNIQTTHYTLASPLLESPLKIAQLSDLHTRGVGRVERKVLRILAEEKPDVIVITGDTRADPFGNYAACRKVYKRISALDPPLGVWFVRGNWEVIRPMRHEREFYREAGIHLLLNQNHELRPDVWLIGLDDAAEGHPDLRAAMRGVPAGVYTIALFHSPFFFDRIAGRVNLCLSGHTHGGQVRLPFIPPFWLPYGSGRFLEGWYEEKGTRMYVNRGIGMSNLPIRFRCRPEITIFTLEPQP